MIYDLLAPFYDSVNREVDYSEWADFFEKVIDRHYTAGEPSLWLDLASGTGKMTIELAKRGYDMTGVDYSPAMLDVARCEAERAGLDGKILWLCQDICEFELYGTVDVTTSCLDVLNHLVDRKSLCKCLKLVHNYLIPDGLFIFDINGRGKFERIYADRSYVMEEEDSVCIWQNDYDAKRGVCDFYITVFRENEDGAYDRYDEWQRERSYTVRSMKRALAECGFEFIGAYRDFDFNEASDADERIYFVARCKK